jgi:aspartate carbamoyltransferase catalytic subunit
MKDLVTIRDLTREDILNLIQTAIERKHSHQVAQPNGQTIASLFFENSTRTRVSSETAAHNLGYSIIGFSGTEGTSVKKGEPLLDTAKMFQGYGAKAIILRHNLAGAARFVADNVDIPVINAGDGSNGHPTQTLLDLMTIYEKFQRLDGLKITIVGDLKYGRTTHSLLQAMELFDSEITLISPPTLSMPSWRIRQYEQHKKVSIKISSDLSAAIKQSDVLYMTRIQRERFPAGPEGEIEFKKVSGKFKIDSAILKHANKHLAILHPLPRDKKNIEIHPDVDTTQHATYFTQAQNGLYMREAILDALINCKLIGQPSQLDNESTELFRQLPITNGKKMGEKLVYRLDTGVLIDHLSAGSAQRIYQILKLDQIKDREVVICSNIRSNKLGRKDVLAIHNATLDPEQLYKISLISPDHTINYIENREVIKKGKTSLPKVLNNHLICKNERCISRKEHLEFCKGKFIVESAHPLQVRCHYCEQQMKGENIEINN